MKDSNSVSITIASPETIQKWSHGEVKSAETINYRTYKPEPGGLFCERIFGPTKDYECACGRYKRIKHKGVVCEHCGVEVTVATVRRERMGHIKLAVPVSHIWFFKCMPSRLGLMLDMNSSDLESIIYYEKYVVTDPGNVSDLKKQQLLGQEEYADKRRDYGDGFKAEMGAAAIKTLLQGMDLNGELQKLQQALPETKSLIMRKKYVRRIRLIEGFIHNNMDPSWMILEYLPVIPPELRPLAPLDGGRFATHDLNELYRRVINRNSRLNNMLKNHTPEVIMRNEERMLQESVDALLDNGRHGRIVTSGQANHALKSLTELLKGKQGRFRQNLLGKRVDYSGRSVIVVGPELNINQCGLPKEMALRLFEPFIVQRLRELGMVSTVRNAKKWIEQRRKEVWDVLDEVVTGHPIMLNRAPTLHRLSIQAFDPILIDGQAIRLHPLVCAAFNADFDGDQMAVHVPLSNEAQLETKLIMLSPNNIFSPANGKPLTIPSHDMILGVYYLCYEDSHRKQAFLNTSAAQQPWFDSYSEVLRALDAHKLANERSHDRSNVVDVGLDIHDFIHLRNPYYRSPEEQARIDALKGKAKEQQEAEDRRMVWGNRRDKYIITTPGRCIYNEIWPDVMGFWNQKAVKKDIANMIKQCFEVCGHDELLKLLDRLKNLGYEWATRAGFSVSTDDMLIPVEKASLIEEANKEVSNVRAQAKAGAITEKERVERSKETWTNVRDKLKKELGRTLENNRDRQEINPIWAMWDSGARGSADQVTQLGGMRGLMAAPNGEILETPILHNFREGLTGLEYFNSTHGSRKGLADTALKTADAGYMTRRLVDVAHDVICTSEDCGTSNGIWIEPIRDGNRVTMPLADRIVGRFAVDDIYDNDRQLIVGAGEEITALIAKKISDCGIEKVHIRSCLTCASERGVCAKCYGRNLATGELPLEGDSLGIIAAQSIGEPGTQLTLRTFHSGGVASGAAVEHEIINHWDHIFGELQSKLDDLEAKAKKNKWSEKKLETERKTLMERENVAFLSFEGIDTVEGTVDGETANIVLNRDGHIHAYGATFSKDAAPVMSGTELATFDIPYGAVLKVEDGQMVPAGAVIATVDPYSMPIIAKSGGVIAFRDLIDGVTIRKVENIQSGKNDTVVIPHRDDIHPSIDIMDPDDASQMLSSNDLADGAQVLVEEGATVKPGDTIAKLPRVTQTKTSDITTGLPRVAELFEARRPSQAAVISTAEGIVFISTNKNKHTVSVINVDKLAPEKLDKLMRGALKLSSLKSSEVEIVKHQIPSGKRLIVNERDFVSPGDRLTEGAPVLQDYLRVCGPQKLQTLLVNAVQSVYLAQGVGINDKHIEIIVRQMMRKVRITDPHDTGFLTGEIVDIRTFNEVNKRTVAKEGMVPAEGEQMLQGITKASLATDSFISAASFQDTPRILTEAATLGRRDYLHGFKENVIMGHLIPAGTGYYKVQNPKLERMGADGQIHEITDEGGHVVVPENDYTPIAEATLRDSEIDMADLLANGAEVVGAKDAGIGDAGMLDSLN